MQTVITQAQSRGLTFEIIQLALPIVGSSLAYALLGFTDTLFMGRISTEALGAVGLGGLMYLTPFLMLRGTVNGVVTFASQAFGANDLQGCVRAMVQFLWLALALSILTPLIWWLMPHAFALTGAEAKVSKMALEFTSIRLLELPLALLGTVLFGFLVALGDSRSPMLIVWAQVILNVFLNWMLALGNLGAPMLGLRGSAIATVLAVFFSTGLVIPVVLGRLRALGLRLEWHRPSWSELGVMLKVSAPLGLMDAVEVGGFTAFLTVIARLGNTELAASQVANQITSLAFMPGFGFSTAASSLVGRHIGARDLTLASLTGFRAMWICVGWMTAVGLIFLFFPEALMRLFSNDPRVVALGIGLLRLMAFYQVFDAVNIVMRGALAGAGDTRFTALVTLFGAWLVMVGGGWLFAFGFGWGLLGAWCGPFIYLTMLGVLYLLRWRSGRWAKALL